MKLLNFTIELAKKAGKIIIKEAKNLQIEEKHKNDLVTNADKRTEEFIIGQIKKKFPDHGILAEEASFNSKADLKKLSLAPYIWLIDPVDGTTNFTHGLPYYCVSIGILKTRSSKSSKNFQYLSGELVVGAIYAPALKELFYAEKGHGAYLNGKKIQVSQTKNIEKSLAVTGFPYEHKETNLPYFTTMMNHTQAIRRLGSAALDLAYVAAGRFELFWEFGLQAWDIAAGALIVEEAGGNVSDINGNTLDLFGRDILATNSKIHRQTIKILSKI